jgi:hypothetical protein
MLITWFCSIISNQPTARVAFLIKALPVATASFTGDRGLEDSPLTRSRAYVDCMFCPETQVHSNVFKSDTCTTPVRTMVSSVLVLTSKGVAFWGGETTLMATSLTGTVPSPSPSVTDHFLCVDQGCIQGGGGCRAAASPPPQIPQNRNLKNTGFVPIVISEILLDLPFSRNQPLKSADD